MIDAQVVQDTLNRALTTGARFAEVFVEDRSSTAIRLDDGKIEEVVAGGDRGAGIRVFHGETQAYAYTNRLDPGSLEEAALAAASAVRDGGDRVEMVDLRSGPSAAPELPASTDVSRTQKVEWLREADDAARAVDATVRQVMVVYGESRQHVMIANSMGDWTEEVRPRIRLFAQVVAVRDDVMQTGFEGPGALAGPEFLRRRPPSATGEVAARMAVAMLDGRPAPAARMPVVLAPGGGGILFHEACGHGLEADLVQHDASIFRGRLGETLASPLVTGVDDGTVPGEWGTNAFDDEATPTHRTVLFDGGTLVGLMYDRLRADGDGVPSTGNGRRQSYAHLPIPRMTNSAILAGDARPEDVVASTPHGLYAKALGGGQVNPSTGDFVFGVAEGYMIEQGKITGAVRGANLIGNGPQILAGIDAVADDFGVRHGICGKDGQGVPVSNGSPTLRIADMTIGGTDA
ncbi:MAG TPA: TldD/PmbA family protein [Actinomycetota bacterium]|nr:TldD/PmbA family protein [Actinomycetota bacterium]